MSNGLAEKGYIDVDELARVLPSEERSTKGPVAVIECLQDIPCNPCEGACPFGAIDVGMPITSMPFLDRDKCKGCGLCIAKCPGLAIFVIDCSGEDGKITLPYEYWPLPSQGEDVICLDRKGYSVVSGRVLKVVRAEANDKTAVITVAVPRKYINIVRNIRRIGG